jgi:large conductance mechanosensitive channel
MSFASEFKEFAMKGNVVDLAVGVVIGAAFGKIVGSVVGDVIMPLLSPLLGSINFSDLSFRIATGMFLQTCLEFLIIAFAIFLVIKGINRLKRPAPSAPPPAPTKTESLLQDIRDILAKRP